MKKILSFFFFLSLLSCIDTESEHQYTQFTSDDLSYLYFNLDTLVFTGSTIYYVDTITFMLNGTERIRVPLTTKIDTFKNPPWGVYSDAGIEGISSLILQKESGFLYATVGVSRQSKYDNNSEKYFVVKANGVNPYEKYFYANDSIHLDTAIVLGVHYNNVLTFEPGIEYPSNIKSIYFAKGFGYIKIETLDGKTMERVLPGN
jgi:hypothetical protein